LLFFKSKKLPEKRGKIATTPIAGVPVSVIYSIFCFRPIAKYRMVPITGRKKYHEDPNQLIRSVEFALKNINERYYPKQRWMRAL